MTNTFEMYLILITTNSKIYISLLIGFKVFCMSYIPTYRNLYHSYNNLLLSIFYLIVLQMTIFSALSLQICLLKKHVEGTYLSTVIVFFFFRLLAIGYRCPFIFYVNC